jgi:hypothetical protein
MAKTIDDPSSPLHGMTLSSLPADVYLEATKSADDIGVLLRSYFLVECACENLCKVLYYDDAQFQHDSLSKHLRALRAYVFSAAVLRMADVVSKHRGPGAHVKARAITVEQVSELNAQSSGVLKVPGTLLKGGLLPTSDGQLISITGAPLRIQYAVLSMVCATAIDHMAEKRKPIAA